MNYSQILNQIKLFYRLRHDGYTCRHYSSPLTMVSKPCLALIMAGDHSIDGNTISWGNNLSRNDTVRFWVRQARTLQPKH